MVINQKMGIDWGVKRTKINRKRVQTVSLEELCSIISSRKNKLHARDSLPEKLDFNLNYFKVKTVMSRMCTHPNKFLDLNNNYHASFG